MHHSDTLDPINSLARSESKNILACRNSSFQLGFDINHNLILRKEGQGRSKSPGL